MKHAHVFNFLPTSLSAAVYKVLSISCIIHEREVTGIFHISILSKGACSCLEFSWSTKRLSFACIIREKEGMGLYSHSQGWTEVEPWEQPPLQIFSKS